MLKTPSLPVLEISFRNWQVTFNPNSSLWKRVLILSLVLLYKIVLCNVFKDRIASDSWGVVGLISVLRVQRYGLLAHTPNFWRRNFGEIFGNFSWNGRNALNASALRRAKKIAQFCALGRRTWPFAPAGGQKCWFAGAQTGGNFYVQRGKCRAYLCICQVLGWIFCRFVL